MIKWIFLVIFCLSISLSFEANAQPTLKNSDYHVETFVEGLSFPTTMTFLGDDIIILEKNSGKVLLIKDRIIQEKSLLDYNVDSILSGETGLLGIIEDGNFVYIYVTEAEEDGGPQIANRIYRYEWNGESLVNEKLIHEFPTSPRTSHVGGVMTKNSSGDIFVVIGDMASSNDGLDGPTQNSENYQLRDTSIILKIVKDGTVIEPSKSENPSEHYIGIGIRNSFGITVDPITDRLWDTENGPWDFDEINLVYPKFNSGWEKIMGFATETQINSLPEFENFEYYNPKFVWQKTTAPTALVFIDSEKFPKNKNNLLVADCINGNLYEFILNKNRTDFIFNSTGLQDKTLNNIDSMREIIFGTGLGCISDLEFGPDGFLYVVSVSEGKIFRIIPTTNNQEVEKFKPFGDLTYLDLKSKNLSKIDLRFGNLTGSDLSNANLSKANLLNVEFTNSKMENIDFSNSNLKQAIFTNAFLQNAKLINSELLGTFFGHANLENANLENAKIKSANFTHAKLNNANLKNVDFRASDLSHVDFSGANLRNADLAHSDLSFANFSGSDLSGLYYYNTNVAGAITDDNTIVDGCFGQDLWNRGLSMIYRNVVLEQSFISNFVKNIIPIFCI